MADFTVRVDGADQAVRALRTMEPETAKQVGKEISSVGKDIAAYIRSNAPSGPPMSGWRTSPPASPRAARVKGGGRGGAGWPAWEPVTATSSRRGTTVVVRMPGASANIYEVSGRVSSGNDAQGAQFIRNISRHGRLYTSGGRPRIGRLAGKAVVEQYPEALRRVQAACDRAVDAVNRRLPSWQ